MLLNDSNIYTEREFFNIDVIDINYTYDYKKTWFHIASSNNNHFIITYFFKFIDKYIMLINEPNSFSVSNSEFEPAILWCELSEEQLINNILCKLFQNDEQFLYFIFTNKKEEYSQEYVDKINTIFEIFKINIKNHILTYIKDSYISDNT